MKTLVLLNCLFLMGLANIAEAKSCTDKPKDQWMKVEDFKKKVEEMGYKIAKFKTPGTCYEIYGTDKEGHKVEIYFNPVDATIVKKEID